MKKTIIHIDDLLKWGKTMKIKRIALISFILFLLIICIGSACADDMEEIDVDKSIATDNGINEIVQGFMKRK